MESKALPRAAKAAMILVTGCAIEMAYIPNCEYDCHAGLQEEITASLIGRSEEDE